MGRFSYSTLPSSESSIQRLWRAIALICVILLVTFWSGTFQSAPFFLKSMNFLVVVQDGQREIHVDSLLVAVAPFGTYIGKYGNITFGNDSRVWEGIRFGKPPIRFASPELVEPSPGKIYPNYNSPDCAQSHPVQNFAGMPGNWLSEDCLFLSITAPRTPSEDMDGYPVMVYIHSGGFVGGLGADSPSADVSTFAQNGIVGVNINYRLGILGNMATTNVSGNFGLEDQRLALKWVQLNIAAFGGDPNKVTIIGSSSGAVSVIAHLASPASNGLYSAGAWSSAPIGLRFPTLNSTINTVNCIFKLAGCPENDIECARNVSWETLCRLQSENPSFWNCPYMPHVDPNGDIPIQPFLVIKNGSYPDVPLLVSFDRDDGLSFVEELINSSITVTTWPKYVSTFIDMFMYVDDKAATLSKLDELYPFTNDTIDKNANDTVDGRPLLAELATDGLSICPILSMLEGAVSKRKPPVYVYMFDHVYSSYVNSSTLWTRDAVLHGTDYSCMFASLYMKDYNSEEKVFCHSLNAAFSNFFQHGDPNYGRKLIPTMYFNQLNRTGDILIMDIKSRIATYPRYGKCLNFWDSMLPFPYGQ